jgi:transcriptional regulator with XRE-family HTH domain
LEAVAEIIDVSQQQVSRYELGQNRLSAAQVYHLARGLDVPVAWFFREFEESDEERQSGQVWGVSEHWEPETQADKQRALLTAWEALPTDIQRERVLAMLEAFSLRAE